MVGLEIINYTSLNREERDNISGAYSNTGLTDTVPVEMHPHRLDVAPREQLLT